MHAKIAFTVALLAGMLALIAPPSPASAQTAGVFRDWRVVCDEDAAAKRCAAVQEVQAQVNETGQPGRLLRLSVVETEAGAQMTILAPLGIDLIKGLTMEIDEGEPTRVPLQSCDASGCRVTANMDDAFVENLRKGLDFYIGYWPVNSEQRLRVQASLRGFTSAIAALAE